jgi:hypothetical protein
MQKAERKLTLAFRDPCYVADWESRFALSAFSALVACQIHTNEERSGRFFSMHLEILMTGIFLVLEFPVTRKPDTRVSREKK